MLCSVVDKGFELQKDCIHVTPAECCFMKSILRGAWDLETWAHNTVSEGTTQGPRNLD